MLEQPPHQNPRGRVGRKALIYAAALESSVSSYATMLSFSQMAATHVLAHRKLKLSWPKHDLIIAIATTSDMDIFQLDKE